MVIYIACYKIYTCTYIYALATIKILKYQFKFVGKRHALFGCTVLPAWLIGRAVRILVLVLAFVVLELTNKQLITNITSNTCANRCTD